MRLNTRIIRALGAIALAAGMAGGGVLGGGPAGATTTAPAAPSAAAQDVPPGYEYAGEFFWAASCDEAGQAGMNRGWSHYVCIGAWNDNYDLWVKPN